MRPLVGLYGPLWINCNHFVEQAGASARGRLSLGRYA
jgi:hypothetical protein